MRTAVLVAPLWVTDAGTRLFKESRSVKVVVFKVAEFIATLKAAVITVEVLTPVVPFTGEKEVTAGPEGIPEPAPQKDGSR